MKTFIVIKIHLSEGELAALATVAYPRGVSVAVLVQSVIHDLAQDAKEHPWPVRPEPRPQARVEGGPPA